MLSACYSSKHLVCLLQVCNPGEQFNKVLILTVVKMIAGGPIKVERLRAT